MLFEHHKFRGEHHACEVIDRRAWLDFGAERKFTQEILTKALNICD
jgi:hypothetical protein